MNKISEKYVCLLRGINVGGHRKILMVDLKKLFVNLGAKNVVTYIQSGNVLFESSELNVLLFSNKVQAEIVSVYKFEVNVITMSFQELKILPELNPYYLPPSNYDPKANRLRVTFVNQTPDNSLILNLQEQKFNDEYHISNKAIFIRCEGKYSETKLTNQMFEKKLNCSATTRNWKTVLKLIEIGS